jgi:hypothetical protein
VARLFHAYVIVHWNAAAKPASGADGVWIGVLKRDVRFRLAFEAHDASTRAKAEAQIAAILADRVKRRERTLIGFDFPLGFPHGLAAGLKLDGEAPWLAVWNQLARMVKDKADNTNNRFGVGSEINRRLTGGPFPFWGCPPRDTLTTLQPKRGREHGPGDVAEFRHLDKATRNANPPWKLYYNGAIGPQALLGVPMVRRLRQAHGEDMRVWPFETGWKRLGETDLTGVAIVAAEVHLAGVSAAPLPGELKEAAQVRGFAEHLARLDEAGRLGDLFAPSRGLGEAAAGEVACEEGWALGA